MDSAATPSPKLSEPLSKMSPSQSPCLKQIPNKDSLVGRELFNATAVLLHGDLWGHQQSPSICRLKQPLTCSKSIFWEKMPLLLSLLKFPLFALPWALILNSDLSWVPETYFPPSVPHVPIFQCLDTKYWRVPFSATRYPHHFSRDASLFS